MKKISAADLKTRTSEAIEAALKEPVTIVKNGRSLLVIISQDEYEQFARFKKHSCTKKPSSKPFVVGSGRNHPSINKNGDEKEYFRAMTDQEVDDFFEGKY